eukprot:6105973-Amphidinium_carterae.2
MAAGPARRPIPELRTLVPAVSSLGARLEDACLASENCVCGVQDPAARVLVHAIEGCLIWSQCHKRQGPRPSPIWWGDGRQAACT